MMLIDSLFVIAIANQMAGIMIHQPLEFLKFMCTGSMHMRLFRRQARLGRSFHYTPHGRRLPECLVRAIGVAEALEFGQLDVQGAHAQLAGAELMKLAAAGRLFPHYQKLASARKHRLCQNAIAVAPALGVAVEFAPPETQKKHRGKSRCVPERCGLLLILRPGSASPLLPAPARPQARPASPRRTPKSLRAPDFGKIRPKKISNADFG